MTYQLPPDIDQRIQSHIALGIYKTPAEVLKNALDALDQRNEVIAEQLAAAEQVMRTDRAVLKKLAE
jgi:Arc/MetJ-type ribon-helix-helix transcriptional regulator